MDAIIANLDYLQFSWKVLLLLFVRTYTALTGCILFGKTNLPNFCRAALSLMLAFFLYSGGAFNNLALPEQAYGLILLVFKEAVYGYFMGVGLSLPFLLVESSGKVVDQQRGEQFAAIINPQTSNISASSSKLIFQTFVAYFVASGGILAYLDIIIKSLSVVHLNEFIPVSPLAQGKSYINLFAGYCYWTVVLIFPVIIVAIVIDLILGLISSFIPQLNVTVLSVPVKSILLLGVLALSIDNILKFPLSMIQQLSQIMGVIK